MECVCVCPFFFLLLCLLKDGRKEERGKQRNTFKLLVSAPLLLSRSELKGVLLTPSYGRGVTGVVSSDL